VFQLFGSGFKNMTNYYVRVWNTQATDYQYWKGFPVNSFVIDEQNFTTLNKEDVEGNPNNILVDDYDWEYIGTPKQPGEQPPEQPSDKRYFVRNWDYLTLEYWYWPLLLPSGFYPDEQNPGLINKELVEGNPDNILTDDYNWEYVGTPKQPPE